MLWGVINGLWVTKQGDQRCTLGVESRSNQQGGLENGRQGPAGGCCWSLRKKSERLHMGNGREKTESGDLAKSTRDLCLDVGTETERVQKDSRFSKEGVRASVAKWIEIRR